MADIRTEVSDVKDDVELLLDEQVIQDQRIFKLEVDSDQLEDSVEGVYLTDLTTSNLIILLLLFHACNNLSKFLFLPFHKFCKIQQLS